MSFFFFFFHHWLFFLPCWKKVRQSARLAGSPQYVGNNHDLIFPTEWTFTTEEIPWRWKHYQQVKMVTNNVNSKWIAIKFSADIHGSQMLNPTNSNDPLAFLLAPSSGQHDTSAVQLTVTYLHQLGLCYHSVSAFLQRCLWFGHFLNFLFTFMWFC